MRSLLYVSANFHSISDVWCFVVRSQDKGSNKKENLHLMSIWTFGKILELFCHKCKWNHRRPFQLVSLAKLLTQIQWKSKISSSAAGRKWTKGEMKIEKVLVLVAPFLDDGSLNGHRIYSDRRIYSPPDWNLGGRGRFSVTKDGFETCKILKKMSAGLICFIARETASRYWASQGQLYPTKVKCTPQFCFWHLMWSI